jgi:hypothetical protein
MNIRICEFRQDLAREKGRAISALIVVRGAHRRRWKTDFTKSGEKAKKKGQKIKNEVSTIYLL